MLARSLANFYYQQESRQNSNCQTVKYLTNQILLTVVRSQSGSEKS